MIGRLFQRALLTSVGLAALSLGSVASAQETSTYTTVTVEETHAQAVRALDAGVEANAQTAELQAAISEMIVSACQSEAASIGGCQTALAFSSDFQTRLASALSLNDSLEMSAYDIGAALREQRDLLIEFDALYRSTSALVVRLVNLRAADREEISRLRILAANTSRNLELSVEAQRLAEERLVLSNDEVQYLRVFLSDKDIEIEKLKAALQVSVSTNEEELVRLRVALDKANTENTTLLKSQDALTLQITTLEAELAKAIETRDIHIRALAQEQAGRLEAEDALKVATDTILSLNIALDELGKSREALAITISGQEQELEILRAQLISVNEGAGSLTDQINIILAERDQLILELQAALASRDKAENEWRLLFLQTEDQTKVVEDLNAELTRVVDELNGAQGSLSDLTVQIDQLTAENARLKDQAQTAGADAARYLEELQLRDAAILILQQNLADAQEQILQLRQELDAALRGQEDLVREIEALRAQLAERDAKITELNITVTNATDELGQGTLSQAGLREQLAVALAEIERLQAELDAGTQAYADLEARCAEESAGQATDCPVIDDNDALGDVVVNIQGDDLEAELRAALLELEILKSQGYVRVENVSAWLTDKMVGREDRTAIEFEPRRFSLLQDLLFDTNSAELKPEGETELRRLAIILRELEENPSLRQQVLFNGYQTPVDYVVQVAGHADPRPISGGPFADNWELASERALTVVRYLEGLGVSSRRIQAASYGDKKLVAGRENEDEVNRRISFTVGIR